MPNAAEASRGAGPSLGVEHSAVDLELPAGACDCHVHIFGEHSKYPFADDRVFMPGPAPVDELVRMHNALGIDRAVVVQASPQGFRLECLLDALQDLERRGRTARGVAVVPGTAATDELDLLYTRGVRGLRVNLQSYGKTDAVAAQAELMAMAQLAAGARMHVQIYTNLDMIAQLHDAIASLPVPVVVDHFGLASAAAGTAQRGFEELLSLVRSGQAYVKLSAPYRIVTADDGSDGLPIARSLIDANIDRMLWGTDWPHTGAWPGEPRRRLSIEPFHPIDDGKQMNIFCSWTSKSERQRILVANPAALYGF